MKDDEKKRVVHTVYGSYMCILYKKKCDDFITCMYVPSVLKVFTCDVWFCIFIMLDVRLIIVFI